MLEQVTQLFVKTALVARICLTVKVFAALHALDGGGFLAKQARDLFGRSRGSCAGL